MGEIMDLNNQIGELLDSAPFYIFAACIVIATYTLVLDTLNKGFSVSTIQMMVFIFVLFFLQTIAIEPERCKRMNSTISGCLISLIIGFIGLGFVFVSLMQKESMMQLLYLVVAIVFIAVSFILRLIEVLK
jgi:hypothetical protein